MSADDIAMVVSWLTRVEGKLDGALEVAAEHRTALALHAERLTQGAAHFGRLDETMKGKVEVEDCRKTHDDEARGAMLAAARRATEVSRTAATREKTSSRWFEIGKLVLAGMVGAAVPLVVRALGG